MDGHVDGGSVREHYAELASTYADRANPACNAAFNALAERWLPDENRALEIGCGAMPILAGRANAFACDYSPHMLHASSSSLPRTCADAGSLPFADDSFNAAITINVLEHVPNPERLIEEAERVLMPGGRFIAVTPNGNVEWLLDLIERLGLKLPEGPHQFLTTQQLWEMVSPHLAIDRHETFLAFPAGPSAFVHTIDTLAPFGLFQYLVARKL